MNDFEVRNPQNDQACTRQGRSLSIEADIHATDKLKRSTANRLVRASGDSTRRARSSPLLVGGPAQRPWYLVACDQALLEDGLLSCRKIPVESRRPHPAAMLAWSFWLIDPSLCHRSSKCMQSSGGPIRLAFASIFPGACAVL
jgi:hypothetical protein